MPPAWIIQIINRDSFNLYNVQLVNITLPGANPSPITCEIRAYNIAESFTQDGNLNPGIYAVMWRVGSNYIFQLNS